MPAIQKSSRCNRSPGSPPGFPASNRTSRRLRRTTAAAFALLALISGCSAPEQGGDVLPDGQLTFVVPYGPGGSTDVYSRFFASALEKELRRPVVVKNVEGAGATIGIAEILRSRPNGSVFGMGTNTALTFQPWAKKNLPWQSVDDYVAFGTLTETPTLLVTSSTSPFHTLQDVIDAARRAPGQVTVGTQGEKTLAHIAASQLQQQTGTTFNTVHFPSASEAVTAVVGGHVDIFPTTVASAKGQVASGDLRPLAVLADQRVEVMPDVPAITELGYQATTGFGLYVIGPNDLPPQVQDRIAALTRMILESPDFQQIRRRQGGTGGPIGIAETEQALVQEQAAMRELVPVMR